MTEHELTPSGYAATVVAACLLTGFRHDLQVKLDTVIADPKLRQYVPEGDWRVLKLNGFRVVPKGASDEEAE